MCEKNDHKTIKDLSIPQHAFSLLTFLKPPPCLLLWSTLIFCLFVGCNKTADFKDLDVLTGKEWQLKSIQQDGIEISESCDLDDVLFFENASTFNYDFGTSVCDEDQGLEKTADTFKIIDDFTTLRMKYKFTGDQGHGELIEYWEIVELNDSTLILKDALALDNNQIPEIRTLKN
ncbi:MAG: hypothetical protein DHS20C18_08410 [Saprospiraceae bacterium]|nr:MAG: hypothetical protein DHS20C18_08410 [Saprospiraceae bacterium]